MSGFRLTPAIIEAVLSDDRGEPKRPPERSIVDVTVGDRTFEVPIVVADAFIAGSGPIGCTFARVLFEEERKPAVVIAEIGSQEGAIKGRHLKNSLKYQKDIDKFVAIVQGHLQPISVVPTHPVLSMYGNNPNQEPHTNLPGSAVTRTVGGMATHWTCCCPKPHEEERQNSPIQPVEFDGLFNRAGTFLSVRADVFDDSIRHTLVKDTLASALPTRGIGNLPLGVQPPASGRNYLTWTGSDTVLGPVAADRMLWMTETRVTYLVKQENPQSIRAAVVRDYNNDTDVLIIAKTFVIACGAVGTPQVLFRSEITPPALGRYLSEQSLAFCQIILRRRIFNSANDSTRYPCFQERIKSHRKYHPNDILPIPFGDLEPQVFIPYNTDTPWQGAIHRDAFSYGDVGSAVDPRIIVDLRFYGKSDIREENRVEFLPSNSDDWTGVDADIYGMPQATFWVTRTDADTKRDQRMMEDMRAVAQNLGEYLPDAQPKFMPPGLALHITGTTRMQPSGTPTEDIKRVSVVDVDSKVHDYKNLWLGGCNVIPDSTACNPTRTAMAYAIKAAEAVHTFLNPPPAPFLQ